MEGKESLGELFSFASVPQLHPLPQHALLWDLGADLNGLCHMSSCPLLSGGPGQWEALVRREGGIERERSGCLSPPTLTSLATALEASVPVARVPVGWLQEGPSLRPFRLRGRQWLLWLLLLVPKCFPCPCYFLQFYPLLCKSSFHETVLS